MAEQPLGITTLGEAQIMYSFVVEGSVRAADLGSGVTSLTPEGELENNVFIETTNAGPRGSVLEAISPDTVAFWFTVESGGQVREFTSRNGHSSVGADYTIEEFSDGTFTVNATTAGGGVAFDVTGNVLAWDSHGTPAVRWNGTTVTDQPTPYIDTSIDPGPTGTRVSGKTGGTGGDGFMIDGTLTSFSANLDQSQYTLTLNGEPISPGELPISTDPPDDGNGENGENGNGENGENGENGNGENGNGDNGENGNGEPEPGSGIDGRTIVLLGAAGAAFILAGSRDGGN